MQNPELVILVDVPPEMETERFLGAVRGEVSPLGLLLDRMAKIALPGNITIVTGRDTAHDAFGTFTALRRMFLCRVYEHEKLPRIINAITGRRAKQFVRVSALHVFADPDILLGLYEYHIERKSLYTHIEGLPAWLGGEAFNANAVMDAYVAARAAGDSDLEPRDALIKYIDQIKPAVYKPKIRGKWKFDNLALGDPKSEQLLISIIKSAPDPIAVTHKDFLA